MVAKTIRPRVGVVTQRVSEAILAEVADACRRIDAEVSFATLEQLELCGADILVAGLGAARRQVPDEYLSFVSRRSPDASLLLLCEDQLVRRFVSLSEGRITLVGPNADADTIYHRLRVLLAERKNRHGDGLECAAPAWWAGHSRGFGRTQPAPDHEQGSLTLAFSLGADVEPAPPASTPALVDSGTGVLFFSPAEQQWLLSWPDIPGTLWLLSSLRLPPMSDLSASHGGRGSARLPAATGDIAIALSAPPRDDSVLELVRGLTQKAPLGGPAVFDALSSSLAQDAWVSVVEVR